jgi:hypothetical protein
MVASPNPVQFVRLPPSGCELGSPGALVGGGSSVIPGRLWTAQGTGDNQVQTPDSSTDVPGLEAIAVDMRTGYKYDCEVDAQFFGTTGTVQITLLGSLNGGGYTIIGSSYPNNPSGRTYSKRLHFTNIAGGLYDHLKVQVINTAGAQATCTYLPKLTALKVLEYTTS